MNYGLRKGLEDIAAELKGIRTILGSMWHSRYKTEETDLMNPEGLETFKIKAGQSYNYPLTIKP